MRISDWSSDVCSSDLSDKEKEILEKWYESFEMDKGYTNELTAEEKDELESRLLGKIDRSIESYEESNTDREEIDAPFAAIRDFQRITSNRTLYLHKYRNAAVLASIMFFSCLGYMLLSQIGMLVWIDRVFQYSKN